MAAPRGSWCDPAGKSHARAWRAARAGSWPGRRSICVGRKHLTSGDRPQSPPDHAVDAALDELDRAVAQEGVDAAGMVAAGIDRREGGTAELLIKPVQVEVHAQIHRPAH